VRPAGCSPDAFTPDSRTRLRERLLPAWPRSEWSRRTGCCHKPHGHPTRSACCWPWCRCCGVTAARGKRLRGGRPHGPVMAGSTRTPPSGGRVAGLACPSPRGLAGDRFLAGGLPHVPRGATGSAAHPGRRCSPALAQPASRTVRSDFAAEERGPRLTYAYPPPAACPAGLARLPPADAPGGGVLAATRLAVAGERVNSWAPGEWYASPRPWPPANPALSSFTALGLERVG